MRRIVVLALGLVCVGLIAATGVLYSKYRKSVADYSQVVVEKETMRQRYGQAIDEIATIQDSLNAIALGEDAARLIPAQASSEVQGAGTSRDQVLAQIAFLKAGIERTKDRIEELERNLHKSGVKVTSLQRMVASLRQTLAEKEAKVAELTTQVDTLQTRVADLNTEVEDQQQEIQDKQREMATVFYAIGTKKELIDQGVVVSKGGVLGFGKTLKPSGTFTDAAFISLDTDEANVIRVPAKTARVISSQPVTSYVLEPAGEDQMELRIVDPKEFCKVKHVVIVMS
jgi:predicted RNase H-like nuclease (RuvC/YqgF family)